MIERALRGKIVEMSTKFPIVSLTGPRQSGKSTLLTSSFPDYRYVSLEDPDIRRFALEDPRSFLGLYDNRVIIDEAQYAPELFSYLQGAVDSRNTPGQYLLSGSQNFLLLKSITQSLAGRVAILKLLPFSYQELSAAGQPPQDYGSWLFAGGYPRLYDAAIDPQDYYPNYVQTYLDRDVRSLSGITRLAEFNTFLRLCASRLGCLVNLSSLANKCGINFRTASSWISALEASYIVFRLPPYYDNFEKRLVKTPKLYFYDTGLAASLLGIQHPSELVLHEKRGALFENAVIAEVMKLMFSQGKNPELYFWRDNNGKEVDLLIGGAGPKRAVEIKSSATFKSSNFSSLGDVAGLLGLPESDRFVVNAGSQSFSTKQGQVSNLAEIGSLLEY